MPTDHNGCLHNTCSCSLHDQHVHDLVILYMHGKRAAILPDSMKRKAEKLYRAGATGMATTAIAIPRFATILPSQPQKTAIYLL